MLADITKTLKRDRLPIFALAGVAIVATLFRSASTFSFQPDSELEMFLYKLAVGAVVALGLVVYFLITQYTALAMVWSGLKAMAHQAAAVGQTIFVQFRHFLLSVLQTIRRIIGPVDQQSPRFTVGSLAIFFSPKHWPYRLYPLSCTLLE